MRPPQRPSERHGDSLADSPQPFLLLGTFGVRRNAHALWRKRNTVRASGKNTFTERSDMTNAMIATLNFTLYNIAEQQSKHGALRYHR